MAKGLGFGVSVFKQRFRSVNGIRRLSLSGYQLVNAGLGISGYHLSGYQLVNAGFESVCALEWVSVGKRGVWGFGIWG